MPRGKRKAPEKSEGSLKSKLPISTVAAEQDEAGQSTDHANENSMEAAPQTEGNRFFSNVNIPTAKGCLALSLIISSRNFAGEISQDEAVQSTELANENSAEESEGNCICSYVIIPTAEGCLETWMHTN